MAYTPGASEPADVFTLGAPGKYLFVLPPVSYRITAFEDANNDRVFEPGSEAGAEPIDVRVGEGEHRRDIDLRLSSTHTGILNNAAVAAQLNAVLETP